MNEDARGPFVFQSRGYRWTDRFGHLCGCFFIVQKVDMKPSIFLSLIILNRTVPLKMVSQQSAIRMIISAGMCCGEVML